MIGVGQLHAMLEGYDQPKAVSIGVEIKPSYLLIDTGAFLWSAILQQGLKRVLEAH